MVGPVVIKANPKQPRIVDAYQQLKQKLNVNDPNTMLLLVLFRIEELEKNMQGLIGTINYLKETISVINTQLLNLKDIKKDITVLKTKLTKEGKKSND